MAPRIPILTESLPTHQIDIRQRPLIGGCRLGRATELVFITATGMTLALSGGAEART